MLASTLTSEEVEERLGLTHKAITRADLTAVTMDLPTNPAEQPPGAVSLLSRRQVVP
jgi:hypothetical protein